MGTLEKMNLNIIDNFYSSEDFQYMITAALLNPYISSWQPYNKFFLSRANAYPCFETKEFQQNDITSAIFLKTLQQKTNLKIKTALTFFRKIYSKELDKIFKYGMYPHQDEKKFNLAGIIYYNSYGLDDGTGLFSDYSENNFQIEPDVIVGSKPNRCVFYDSQIWHRPFQDKNTETRIVQPFFITLE
jgi:hypothetical protein